METTIDFESNEEMLDWISKNSNEIGKRMVSYVVTPTLLGWRINLLTEKQQSLLSWSMRSIGFVEE